MENRCLTGTPFFVYVLDVVDLTQHFLRVVNKLLTLRRQFHPFGGAIKNSDSEIRLQFLDAAAQIGLCDIELLRRLVDRADPGDLHSVFHVQYIHKPFLISHLCSKRSDGSHKRFTHDRYILF